MKSIEARLQRAERAVTPINKRAVFATVERRGGILGIILPDGEWLSMEEAKVSPRCRNVIAFDKEEDFMLWRSKMTLCDFMALASINKGKD